MSTTSYVSLSEYLTPQPTVQGAPPPPPSRPPPEIAPPRAGAPDLDSSGWDER